jgi:hypothetical protein
MSTTKKVEAGSMLAVAAFVLILVAVGFFRISGPDRGNDAWSERLSQQAQYLQDKALAARAADAWSQRLTGLAGIDFPGLAELEPKAAGMSDRANAAWADRLNGLAEYYAAQK